MLVSYNDTVLLCESMLADGFVNESGLVTIEQNAPDFPGDGNGLLQTGLWYCIKASLGPLKKAYTNQIEELLSKCMHANFPLFWRSPHKHNPGDTNKQDDYYGILAMCYHAKETIAADFYQYGERMGWFINIENPGVPPDILQDANYYFDRFPGFRILAKAAQLPVNPNSRLTLREHLEAFLVAVVAAYRANGSDAAMRDYCWFSVLARESTPVALVSYFWLKRIEKKYSYMGLAWAPYFKTPKHPLCVGNWRL